MDWVIYSTTFKSDSDFGGCAWSFDPAVIGFEMPDLILTARSGRAALRHRMEILDIHVQENEFEQYYAYFLQVADTKSIVADSDLIDLCTSRSRKVC